MPETTEHWRPRYHYSPLRNWMNDPNGLVWFDGEYHLYYQYNPLDAQWGRISWGHAVSTDLVSWRELPVAIEATDGVMAFSGSTVVDHRHASGFAPPDAQTPPLLAFYTGFDPVSKRQSQYLACSLDRGRSYLAYEGNPVVDAGMTEFRDPKVFWYEPKQHWVMLVVAALQQEVWFYQSSDLKSWTRVSAFGPTGSSANNIWEVPELFELPVVAADGSPTSNKRWVLVVSVNHGSPWGGSGVQYFVGDFDGRRFVADPREAAAAVELPQGDPIADFEGGALPPGWQLTGSAFGTGPVAGTLPGQNYVSGHLGRGLMNSFHGGDAATGSLASPTFTITKPFISFLIGGSRGPSTRLELLVDGLAVRQASGDGTDILRWQSWDVSALVGQPAVIRAVDEATDGHILVDRLLMVDAPVPQPDMAAITHWADHGRDFYAPITFANMPDGRVAWLGWVSNWDYATRLPTSPWRGQQSAVRQLDLASTPVGLRLRQRVVDEARALVDPEALIAFESVPAADAKALLESAGTAGRQLMARLRFAVAGLEQALGLELFKGATSAVRVGYDPLRRSFFVDRTTSQPPFAGYSERHDAARLLDSAEIELEVWADGSIIEVFADGGTVVLTDLVYPDAQANGVSIFHGPENPLLLSAALHLVRACVHVPAA
ncbi:MAG: glycoside hydrolase family 32 protein [Burkholderiales bacterium]|nr:glycoside hydrolase family 32 protein [Burkholderiales bacterium]